VLGFPGGNLPPAMPCSTLAPTPPTAQVFKRTPLPTGESRGSDHPYRRFRRPMPGLQV